MDRPHSHGKAPQPAPGAEFGPVSPEFISTEGVEHLVVMAIERRVDQNTSRLLPLEEELMLMNGPGYMMKPLPSRWRHDLVLPEQPRTEPYHDGGTLEIGQKYSISGEIYRGLTGESNVSLGAPAIKRIGFERAKLEQTLAGRHDLKWILDDWQAQDAYQVSQRHKPNDGQLVSPVRIYVPVGIRGVEVMNRILSVGADFAHAKIWAAQAARGWQEFRRDTPILIANTLGQLRSVVNAVRAATRDLPAADTQSPVGIPIEGTPGAFVAQPGEHASFNGQMASFWEEPIRIACNSLPLRAGQIVTFGWTNEVARRAKVIAQQQAEAQGLNPASHALAPGQNIDVIMEEIRVRR